jgi:hypothetical protein
MAATTKFTIKIGFDSYDVEVIDLASPNSAKDKLAKWQRGEKYFECQMGDSTIMFGKELGPTSIVTFKS